MEQYINNAPFALVIVFLIIGFVFLIKGVRFFLLREVPAIAKKLKVPSIIIGLTGWATLARLLRAETLKISQLDYIQAARAFGLGPF